MRLASRARIVVVLSVGALLIVGLAAARSLGEARAAREEVALAAAIQRTVFERGVLRDEYLWHGEPRALAQWRAKSAEIVGRLALAEALFRADEARRTIHRMEGIDARLQETFAELVAQREAAPAAFSASPLFQRRVSSLVLRYYDLSGRATALAESARARLERASHEALVVVIGVSAAALLGGLANAVLASRLVQRRLAQLGQGAARLAGGDLSHRLAPRGDDELADLGRAFDAMADRLQGANGALAATNRELEAFSYSVSHDLRAPLRHVAGFVGLLEQRAGAALDAEARRYLEVISRAAGRMGALIDDLLAFSRVGRTALHLVRVEQRPLVDDVLREQQAELDGREVAWAIGPLPDAAADPVLLRQVWANLLSNAVKFTRPRRPARIELGGEAGPDGTVRCWVRDNGVGFDMRYADKLFGVFQRLHRDDEFEGTGVGLANVQRIVARHGGRVGAEATVGEGATFWFTLPPRETDP